MTEILKKLLASAALVALTAGTASAQVHVTIYDFNIFATPNAESSAGIDFAGSNITGTDTWATIDSFAHYGGDWNPNSSFGALVTTSVNVGSTGSHTFSLGSDDASYLFVDGSLIGSLPGSHGYSAVDFSTNLTTGLHSVELQFYNSFCCGSRVTVGLGTDVSLANAVPEPGTYAMILAGLGLLGFAARRRRLPDWKQTETPASYRR